MNQPTNPFSSSTFSSPTLEVFFRNPSKAPFQATKNVIEDCFSFDRSAVELSDCLHRVVRKNENS
jgi:hypothetical protein